MMIKLTTAFVAAAAFMSAAAQAALQCDLQTFKSNIIQVEVFSDHDLSFKYPGYSKANHWADVTLTEDYHQDVRDAKHHITMRHNGTDCRNVSAAKDNICNINYVYDEPGNSCAQVTHRSHRLGWTSGKALDISEDAPNSAVHFRAVLAPSLQSWSAGLPNTCATQTFDAPDKGFKVMTFSASNLHQWSTVVVTLDEPDNLFGVSWQCQFSDVLNPDVPRGTTEDNGKTWTFHNIKFDPILRSDVQEPRA